MLNPVLKPLETLETLEPGPEPTVLDDIQIRHTVCPVCSRYRQINQATRRCHCASQSCKHTQTPCPLAHCKRVEARRG